MTFADKVIQFNRQLKYTGDPLPEGIRIMNPFQDERVMDTVEAFYRKYYGDNRKRHLILGINPGRFGGGHTGIPFTDTKRMISECKIAFHGKITHEPSSVFVYKVINAFGGAETFYKDFFINSPCPLGFTSVNNGKEKNYNYYDSRELANAVRGFMIENIRKLIDLGIYTDVCICLGTGKNEKFLNKLNEGHKFFGRIIPLEHPRYIMQYKSAGMEGYVEKYVEVLKRQSAVGSRQ